MYSIKVDVNTNAFPHSPRKGGCVENFLNKTCNGFSVSYVSSFYVMKIRFEFWNFFENLNFFEILTLSS